MNEVSHSPRGLAEVKLTMNHDPVIPSRAAKAAMLPKVFAYGQKTSCSSPPRKKERKRVLTGPRRSARKPARICCRDEVSGEVRWDL